MISIAAIVCIIGFLLWLIFAKTKLADPWISEVGRLCFFAGSLAWLFSVQGKSLF